jgi:hypothetical protein
MTLTRRRDDNPHQKGWDVYFGDVRIGHIGTRAGVPKDVDQWGWSLGFYPGTDVGQAASGVEATFEECRSAFERAWHELKPRIREVDYERWRHQRDFTAWKNRMWDLKLLLPTQTQNDRAKCFCGAEITSRDIPAHVRTKHRGIGDRTRKEA